MPKRTLIAVLVLVWLMSMTVAAWAADDTGPNLVPEISWDKEAVFPGADVAVQVKYTNEGTAPVPNDAQFKFHLEIREISADLTKAPQVVRQSEEIDVPEARGKGTGQTFSVSAQIAAPPEGNYNLVAILTEPNKAPVEHAELFGVKSALPPGLARLFAGLGMFAAVMAIMAVGTEVVIDSVKFFLGMKQKVTALEALNKLKEQLPGQLAELGVGKESRAKIDKLFGELDITLRPLQTARDVYAEIQKGKFKDAFAEVKKLEPELDQLQSQQSAEPDKDKRKTLEDQITDRLEKMKQAARACAGEVLARLGDTFKLNQAIVDQLRTTLDTVIDGISNDSILAATDRTAELVGPIFLEIQKKGPEWTANWLKTQADTYLTEGRNKVVELLDSEVLAVLADLGLSKDNVDAVKNGAVERIDGLQMLLQEKAASYTLAVRNLLTAVEEKRNEMQSPARKIWRRLRRSDQLSFWGTLIGVVLGITGVVVVCLVRLPVFWLIFWMTLASVIAIIVALIIGFLVKRSWPNTLSLGEGLAAIETFVNKLIGRKENPDGLGAVEADIRKEIAEIGPTNVAAVLLKREDKHQDEEASRIRMLRIISILVGGVLAYLLQIDALLLLEEALPGAAKINFTLVTAQQWSVLNYDLTAGIILTGLAAGAGSKFWRDLLGRLQATKEQAESAAILLRKAKSSLGLEEG